MSEGSHHFLRHKDGRTSGKSRIFAGWISYRSSLSLEISSHIVEGRTLRQSLSRRLNPKVTFESGALFALRGHCVLRRGQD